MKITLCEGSFGWDYVIRAEDGSSILIQSDMDYPGAASTFGWRPDCGCDHTDGTIACEHHAVQGHLDSAQDYLDEHIGDTAEDPGYFT